MAVAFTQFNTNIGGTGLTAYTATQWGQTDSEQYVYLKSEYPAVPADAPFVHNPYKILGIQLIAKDVSAVDNFVEADLVSAATGGIRTTDESPWFYVLQNVGNNKVTQAVHSNLLTNLAGVRTLVGASATSGWVDPA